MRKRKKTYRARSRKRAPTKKRKTTKRKPKRKGSKHLAKLRRQRAQYERTEAERHGVSVREYRHRRAVRERAHRAEIDRLFAQGGRGAVFRYLIKRGQLDTRDPGVLAEAGITEAEAEQITRQMIAKHRPDLL